MNTLKHKIFVYGTLLIPSVQQRIIGRECPVKGARLHGFRKDGLNILEYKGGTVAGQILHVTDRELVYLDNYETSAYHKLPVEIEGEDKIFSYQLVDRDMRMYSPYSY